MAARSVLVVMMLVVLLLGMFMGQVTMLVITLPVCVPIELSILYDRVWWGLVMLLALEVSFTTPPFGLLLFVMQGVAPAGTRLSEVAYAALPYILCVFLLIGLLILFPDLATWLPSRM